MMNPYTVLGVDQKASQEEIKKSYRKLAKLYHPDMNQGNKDSEKKFKEISHAFDLIGTPENRAKFDRGETAEQQQHHYEQYQKRGARSQNQNQGFSFSDMGMDEDLFQEIFGGGRRGTRSHSMNMAGEDVIYKMDIDFDVSVLGGERVITLPEGKTLNVKIPAGIETGKKLRFKGMGHPGHGNAPAGDAYIEINVTPHPKFIRDGKDLITEVPLSFFEALNGAEIPVQTLDGQVMVKVPSGVTTGTKLRVKGKGVAKGNELGDLFVKLKVTMPKTPSPDFLQAINQLAEKYNYDPRVAA